MRILFFTDSHIRGTTPKNRKDDFTNTLEKKFNEIVEIIDKENIDYVIHGGDLFDRPDVSISLVSKFSKILNEIKVPIYIISGNHDIFGLNPKTLNRTMLGLICELKVLNIIDTNEKIILKKDKVKVQLTGQPYTYNIDDSNDKSPYIVKDIEPGCDFSIHVVHGMLLDKPFIKGIPYTLVEDIKETLADITLSGHYHSGFEKVKIDGKYFLNPGSIVRVSNSLREIKRKPKVAIIDLEKDLNISYKYLSTALDGEEVLDRKEIENSIYRRERMYEFKQTIDNAMNFEKIDINDVLMGVSNAEKVDEKVKKEALKRISLIQMRNMTGE
ncbi:metallophosphoesterase family protein [Tissierella creatinophila]|uniref:3',5'-cyclic adenosine monophosphate phosphodiesterase CpdA n=1 Tax=Tissierella creatinophila DSM 6911 TaxID=1123403 RepID=A0A1U7M3K3_TISCR|nr:metallophosphoesterase [Tissierella creatinophila]OLS01778.1 3',5'-cyclic adenosine monophosphate phosphodiesterase CpdA [Tissierella creatinophila DSM 6911]